MAYLAILAEPDEVGVKLHGFDGDCKLLNVGTYESEDEMVDVLFLDKKSSLIAAMLNGDLTTYLKKKEQ